MFLQSWKTPMRNGYLQFFVINTKLENDAENQSLLCAEIMRKGLAVIKSHCVSGWNFCGREYKNYHFAYYQTLFLFWYATNWFQVYFSLNIFMYLPKIRCLPNALNLFWLRLVYLKTDMRLHSYRLPEKPHRIGKKCISIRDWLFFKLTHTWCKRIRKFYNCTDAIWSTVQPKSSTHFKKIFLKSFTAGQSWISRRLIGVCLVIKCNKSSTYFIKECTNRLRLCGLILDLRDSWNVWRTAFNSSWFSAFSNCEYHK